MSTTPVGPTGSPQVGTSQPWVVRVAGRISAILHRRPGIHVVATLAGVLLVALLIILGIALPGLRTTMLGREGNAVTSLQMVNEAESAYARAYNVGYSHTLAGLGEPPGGGRPLDSGANVLVRLGSGLNNGYRFTYTPGPPDKAGHIQTYSVNARPLHYGKSGRYNVFTDQSCVIRMTEEDRPATSNDPAIGK